MQGGLAELTAGKETIYTLLLEIACGRLRLAGVPVPAFPADVEDPEFRLLRMLSETHGYEAH